MTTIGVLAFIVALLLSVMLHEAGHFLTARRYGMKATQFFVGFGPTLFSRQKGETEYGVKAIPAGGFVKIIGMTPLEEVEPGDEDRAFYRQSIGRKTVVLAAGSTVHFLICIVLVFAAVLAIGVPDPDAAVMSKPQDCLPLSITAADTDGPDGTKVGGLCPAGTVPGPAAQAGFTYLDKVVSVQGRSVKDYTDFRQLVRRSPGQTLAVVVERDGAQRTLSLTPVLTTRPDDDKPEKPVRVGAVGLGPSFTAIRDVGIVNAVPETGTVLKLFVVATYKSLTEKLDSITKVYSKERDREGFIGVVGAGRVTGEVFEQPVPFTNRLLTFLMLIASLNLFIGIFNLLPLLPLDGGHIAVVWFESVRDRLRRARGYVGEIQRVDYNKLMPVTLAVVILFAGFTLWLLGADIVNPIRLGG